MFSDLVVSFKLTANETEANLELRQDFIALVFFSAIAKIQKAVLRKHRASGRS